MIAANKKGNIPCAVWENCVESFYNILEFCRIKTFAPKNACVYGDNRFLSIFAAEDPDYTLSIEIGIKLRNIITDKIFEKQVLLHIPAEDGMAFKIIK